MKPVESQLTQIKTHLIKHKSISSWEAIQTYQVTRLSQYILLLRKEGYPIVSKIEKGNGKWWTKYILETVKK